MKDAVYCNRYVSLGFPPVGTHGIERLRCIFWLRSLFLCAGKINMNKINAEVVVTMSKKVAVIMGSDSDFPVVSAAVKKLKAFGIPCEVHVMSAHRTPHEAAAFSQHAAENGFGVIIAAAGKAAHLAGVLAAHTTLPVIGLPIKSSTLDGLDALLATVQMPSGIPVATVAIDGAANAAILAAQILAVGDEALAKKLEEMKTEMAEGVRKKDAALQAEVNAL